MRTRTSQRQKRRKTGRVGSALRIGARLPRTHPAVALRSGGHRWSRIRPTRKARRRKGAAAADEGGLTEAFFATACRPAEPVDNWEDLGNVAPMSRGSRRGMYAACAIVVIGLLGMGTLTAYHYWMMPVPVKLGLQTATEDSRTPNWP